MVCILIKEDGAGLRGSILNNAQREVISDLVSGEEMISFNTNTGDAFTYEEISIKCETIFSISNYSKVHFIKTSEELLRILDETKKERSYYGKDSKVNESGILKFLQINKEKLFKKENK